MPTTVQNILESHSPEIRALAERFRAIIQEAVPSAVESAHASWHSLNYRHPESGHFCAIFPHDDHVALAFEYGVLLPDPDRLLEGNGKQVRYVRIREAGDLRPEALKALLQAAIDLPESRAVKLEMIRAAAKPVQDTTMDDSG